eukprot:TRINITY_DN6_c0_g1_i1.p1 TRINITY_DN6_c0_g1~~TRINITY_DN6_c0_g1_i1.p1  ORF type:complete len:199 (+),score=32.22 TRINITY_DN6_c0_g1_i1:153-749(+)
MLQERFIVEPRPCTTSESRKVLLRSTGSFSVVEENIVVPTPRKLSSVPSSPARPNRKNKRTNSREENQLFGEASQEIKTILMQSMENLTSNGNPVVIEVSPGERVIAPPRVSLNPLLNIPSPTPSPPIRASNPMVSNTPFHRLNEESDVNKKDMNANKRKETTQKAVPGKDKSCKFRSSSWPGSETALDKLNPTKLVT